MGTRFVELTAVDSGSVTPDYVPGTIGTGRQVVSTAGVRVQLASSLTIGSILIVAEYSNNGVVCVGDNNVVAAELTRQGIPLDPRDGTIVSINDISKIWIDSTIDGDGVTWLLVE